MKVFHCDHCGQLVYFENTTCLSCGTALAFLPDVAEIRGLDPADEFKWRSSTGRHYRLCQNYSQYNVCNWAVPVEDENPFCVSCRLNQIIPDLSVEGNIEAWAKFEAAKRRLNYSLIGLGLPLTTRAEDPQNGLAYEFKADSPGVPVLTGHEFGVITINIAEADDAEREKRRISLHEPYRSILGHFRHEVGHYYWDRFFANDEAGAEAFRQVFGDERVSYDEALKAHYQNGAPANWQDNYISAYATCHPWEDWAETWAHYLHIADTVETAASSGLALLPKRPDEPSVQLEPEAVDSFDAMMESWLPLTYLLNNLNRGLGLRDGYPFVISPPIIEKLRFVHHAIGNAASRQD